MPQPKDKDWLNGLQKKDPLHMLSTRDPPQNGTHTWGLVFLIHSASLCLLVGAFNPFTLKVIIDKYDPIAIYFIVLGLNLYTLFVFPV